jgi:hypothetical protein
VAIIFLKVYWLKVKQIMMRRYEGRNWLKKEEEGTQTPIREELNR